MRTFRFNTGVKIWDNSNISGGIDSGNGTVVIPFSCENVPSEATFLYACDTPDLCLENKNIIFREIQNSKLLSKYAYFKL